MTQMLDGEADQTAGTPHPRTRLTFVGHVEQERELLDAYRRDRLPHAIILGGPSGIGKATLAWRLARFILANPLASSKAVVDAVDLSVPAGNSVAALISSLSHPDVSLLRREFNEKTKKPFTEIRADDVRRSIGLFQRAAGAGGYRICIVDSAEDLNRSSANALLKLIEEPPPRSVFILIAHRPGLILPTIRSRARVVRLQPLAPVEIGEVVRSLGFPWSEHGVEEIATAAEEARGSVQQALRRLGARNDPAAAGVTRLLDALPTIDWRELHRLADQVAGRDGDAAFEAVLSSLFDWLNGAVRSGASGAPHRLAPYVEVWEKVAAQARETDALNLDRRPLILSIFPDIAAAVRRASG